MQVSQSNDYITHVSIGGGTVQEFTIADSPEFFQVLSKALYPDGQRATVREILCNAWDAHLAAGVSHLPVQITLTNTEIIFRDFGNGIPPAKMGETYGTYGQSTKTHDGHQTGGFGLGSKAPFSVTDYFEVTSFYRGTKTIYNVALSSQYANGKPAAQPIVTLPTDETGLQVRIPIEEKDQYRYASLIKEIVRFGDMNVELNGEKLETISISEFPDGFYVASKAGSSDTLHVRYGSVIYPIPQHFDYADDWTWFQTKGKEIFGSRWSQGLCTAVFQAKPHTIAVTPSRETLSLNERTVETLTKLLKETREKLEQKSAALEEPWLRQSIERLWLGYAFSALYRPTWKPGPKAIDGPIKPTNLDAFVEANVARSCDWNAGFILRLESLAHPANDPTGLARSLLKTVKQDGFRNHSGWLQRCLRDPLWSKLNKHPVLNPKQLFILANSCRTGLEFEKLETARNRANCDCLPFTRNVIALGYSRADIRAQIYSFPAMVHRYGQPDDMLAYITPRKAEHVAAAKAFFEARGYYVLDMTVHQPWEKPAPAKQAKPKTAPKPKGFFPLSQLMEGKILNLTRATDLEITDRIGKPAFYIKALPTEIVKNPFHFVNWTVKSSLALTRLFGNQGVLVTSAAEAAKAEKAGALKDSDWLSQKLVNRYKKHKNLHKHLSHTRGLLRLGGWAYTAAQLIQKDEVLAKAFRVHVEKDQELKDILTILSALAQQKGHDLVSYCETLFGKVTASSAATQLHQVLYNHTSLDLIDWTFAKSYLVSTFPERKKLAQKLIITAVKG